jgi:hypothetical protein
MGYWTYCIRAGSSLFEDQPLFPPYFGLSFSPLFSPVFKRLGLQLFKDGGLIMKEYEGPYGL